MFKNISSDSFKNRGKKPIESAAKSSDVSTRDNVYGYNFNEHSTTYGASFVKSNLFPDIRRVEHNRSTIELATKPFPFPMSSNQSMLPRYSEEYNGQIAFIKRIGLQKAEYSMRTI